MNWIGSLRSIANSLTGTMTEDVFVDRDYAIHRHAAVTADQPFVAAMRSAANRAYESAINEGRTPTMIEVIVRVAPQSKVA